MPAIRLQNGQVVGNVVTGEGNAAMYGGVGINPANSKVKVSTMVIAIIGTRIDKNGDNPEFIPTYYNT